MLSNVEAPIAFLWDFLRALWSNDSIQTLVAFLAAGFICLLVFLVRKYHQWLMRDIDFWNFYYHKENARKFLGYVTYRGRPIDDWLEKAAIDKQIEAEEQTAREQLCKPIIDAIDKYNTHTKHKLRFSTIFMDFFRELHEAWMEKEFGGFVGKHGHQVGDVLQEYLSKGEHLYWYLSQWDRAAGKQCSEVESLTKGSFFKVFVLFGFLVDIDGGTVIATKDGVVTRAVAERRQPVERCKREATPPSEEAGTTGKNTRRIRARVVGCLTPGYVRVLLGPDFRLVDAVDIPLETVPRKLRFPNREFEVVQEKQSPKIIAVEPLRD